MQCTRRKNVKTVGRYDLASKASLLIEPFFNSTVCYAPLKKGKCPNGTQACPPEFGHSGSSRRRSKRARHVLSEHDIPQGVQ